MSVLLSWSAVTDKEAESVVGKLLSHVGWAIASAEDWCGSLSHRPTARKNFKRNLRAAQVRYAAVRQLRPGYTWPHYEERLKKLLAHEWAKG